MEYLDWNSSTNSVILNNFVIFMNKHINYNFLLILGSIIFLAISFMAFFLHIAFQFRYNYLFAIFVGILFYFKLHSKQKIEQKLDLSISENFNLSKLYNEKFKSLTVKPIRIIEKGNSMGAKNSPISNLFARNYVDIDIDINFFNTLSSQERDALILHELGHAIHKDNLIIYTIASLFWISMASGILSILVYHFVNPGIIFIYITLLFIIILFLSVIILKLLLPIQQYAADRYALSNGVEKNILIDALEKSFKYADMHSVPKRSKKHSNMLKKRITRIEEFQ